MKTQFISAIFTFGCIFSSFAESPILMEAKVFALKKGDVSEKKATQVKSLINTKSKPIPVVFSSNENTILINEFRSFDPPILVEDSKIINVKHHDRSKLYWWDSYATFYKVDELAYKDWKMYMSEKYRKNFSEEAFIKVKANKKKKGYVARKTIFGVVDFQYKNNRFIALQTLHNHDLEGKSQQHFSLITLSFNSKLKCFQRCFMELDLPFINCLASKNVGLIAEIIESRVYSIDPVSHKVLPTPTPQLED